MINKNIVIGFFLIAGIIIGFGFAQIYSSIKFNDGKTIPESKISDGKCNNLSLKESVYCLRDKLQENYYYNISNIAKGLTDEELFKEGGVCWHYSAWYAKNAEKLGFKASQENFTASNTKAHSVAVISDDTGYCYVDQLNIVGCEYFNQEVKNEK